MTGGERAQLLKEHDELRVLMDRCEMLADDFELGGVEAGEVLEAVAALRTKLASHIRFEEHVLRPISREDILDEDHVAEHATMHAALDNAVTRELRTTIARLRHHLVAEERYFAMWSAGPRPASDGSR